jgi:hypothetical protein
MPATTILANALLNHLCGKAAFAMPSSLWLGLFTAAPSAAGGGTEAAFSGYARVELAGEDWAAPAGGAVVNAEPIEFPVAGSGPTIVTHWGLFNAATGGQLLEFAALTDAETIAAGVALRFPAGALSREID